MALEKDKERPNSPKQRLSMQRKANEGFGYTINSQSDRQPRAQDENESK